MPRVPPRKQKGPHNPVDDRLLLELWIACRIERPTLTKEEFARIAQKNYYQKGLSPEKAATIETRSIVRHLNRLLSQT
jgi:hypothetical protein